MRRRKVMLEQDAAQAQLEEKRCEELVLSKLARQSQEERQIGEQLWIARKEKDAMRHNRELRDQQLAEAARQSELARRAHDRALGEHARQEYMERLAREREAAAENESARQAVTRQKHEATCRRIAEQLVALAGRVVDFRATAALSTYPIRRAGATKIRSVRLQLVRVGPVDHPQQRRVDAPGRLPGGIRIPWYVFTVRKHVAADLHPRVAIPAAVTEVPSAPALAVIPRPVIALRRR
jgi:hypothetical protein